MATKEFSYEIVRNVGILSTNKSGWNREVNVVRWNNGNPKIDIRDWAPDHSKMGKGCSMTAEEVSILKEILEEEDPYQLTGEV